ncbi:MAG TPA: MaoC family dehydratase N-terminal domain-containing protein [Candidatus Binataceae bacterium]
MKAFEKIQIGDTLGPLGVLVSKDQARNYARACRLEAPRFMDDEGARKEGLPGMILPGNMSLGLLTKLVTDWIGSNGAKVIRIGTTYRVPVQPDHKLTLHGFVTHVTPEDRVAEIDVWMENEDAERLVTGTASVQFPK